MTAFESGQSPHSAKERPGTGSLAPDSESLPCVNVHSTLAALSDLLGHDNPSAQDTAAILQRGKSVPSSLPTLAPKPPSCRQGLLEFTPEPGETPASDAETQHQPNEDQPQSLEGSPLPGRELLECSVSSGLRRTAFPRGANGAHPRSPRARAKTPGDERTLFDYVATHPAIGEPQASAPDETPPPAVPRIAADSEAPNPPGLSASRLEHPAPTLPFTIASGEKAKAHDIIAAIRALKVIELEQRTASPDERATLARFAGFGPVALSIFPDPVSGRYKDAHWQTVGKELAGLLTGEEYASAKRTTFNAFYTSPTVIAVMHDAMRRLGLPVNATILEPGCGTGNFLSLGQQGLRFIGIELDRTHSSFERIGMSCAYQEQFLNQQIQEYDQLLRDGASKDATRTHRNLIKTIEKQKAKREERLKDLLAQDKKDDGLVFDELGVDHIFIDEAQYYKNLETPTKMERVAGIQTGGSERAFDVYMKARYLHQQHPGHGVTFATGTPISNTMVEMYTMQRFLDPEGLRQRGLEHFDAWAATFGEVIDTMEIAPDGASLRPRSRFARFTNLPELQQMFRAFADVQTADMLDLPRPRLESGKPIVVACPMSVEQRALQQHLVERYERIRSQKVDPREDNALAITTDGRKLAIDARMLAGAAPDFPGSKVNALVESVAAIWSRTAATRGTQMIFCDMSVHPTPWGYSAYDEVTMKLVAHGIPREHIAAVGDADSDAKKQSLFEKVRNGQVRVLLGSTQKMGTGTNVQKRLVALHHLDAPWKPAEVEQREGRILRQGNENEEVAVYRYVTEGSFDAYMWQTLETKARFIAQVITGDNAARRAEDIGRQELSYAEVKAIASGNPAVLTLAEADAELQRLAILKKNHLDEQYVARRSVRDLPRTIADLAERLSNLTTDQATVTAHAADLIAIGSCTRSREDAPGILASHLDSLARNVRETCRVSLGIYRGLRFGLVLHPQFSPDVYLEGAATRQSMLPREHHGPRAILNAVERLATAYRSECDRVRQDLAIAESHLRDYQARLGKPFLHGPVLSELANLRDRLKACLSGTNPSPDTEPRPSVSELAEQIKALKAANTIETTRERVGKRRSSAEEPVTARIRRRMDAILASDPSVEPDDVRMPGDERARDRIDL